MYRKSTSYVIEMNEAKRTDNFLNPHDFIKNSHKVFIRNTLRLVVFHLNW